MHAQAAETIWMESSQQTYNAGDTITVTIKAISSTPIQGFNFQLRYDPACLQPSVPTGLLPGLNYMSVPQTEGLVDGIFASTTPLSANGALAEIQFKALAACQTSLQLEKASLAVLDASRMAVPLQGVSLGASTVAFNGGNAAAPAVQPTNQPEANATNPADANQVAAPEANPTAESAPAKSNPLSGLFLPIAIVLGILLLGILFIVLRLVFQGNRQSSDNTIAPARKVPALFIKRGPQAGTTLPLVRFPCRIGSDPENEICINDARISPAHAEIFAD